MLTPSLLCCTSIWILSAKDCASSCELACARIVAEILTSRPDSPCTLISPNLCSTRTDCPDPIVSVLLKSRVTVSCGQLDPPAAKAGTAANKSAVTKRHATRPTRQLPSVKFDATPFIALPPEYLAASAAFLRTSPAAVGA